jgi:hypothetical protein
LLVHLDNMPGQSRYQKMASPTERQVRLHTYNGEPCKNAVMAKRQVMRYFLLRE